MHTAKVIHRKGTSISIRVTKDGEVIVRAPHYTPKFVIDTFLRTRQSWIDECLAKVNARKPKEKNYHEGEEFYFLGTPYTLTLTNDIEIAIKDNMLLFPKVFLIRAQKELKQWYITQAKQIMLKRIQKYAMEMKTSYKDVFFSDTTSKWGTCFEDNTLQFNWRLIMAPLMVIDYVIIHELVHTTEKHHQDAFWRKVKLYTPAFKQHRKWLDRNMSLLSF